MINSVIAKLEKQGKLKKQKSGLVQVEALLREAMLDLREIKKIVHLVRAGDLSVGLYRNA